MSTSFTAPTPSCTLSGHSVWAFDPVTLKRAALAAGGTYPAVLDQPAPPEFDDLAKVTITPLPAGNKLISAKIETGLMRWVNEDVSSEPIDVYTWEEKEGVCLDLLEVAEYQGNPLTRAAMILDGGKKIWVWFLEHDEVTDAYQLLTLAMDAMAHWRTQPRVDSYVWVPALEIKESFALTNLSYETRQSFTIELDENGAKVIAETYMCTGVPVNLPPSVRFGENKPVITWFSSAEDDALQNDETTAAQQYLPFTIVCTTANAWKDTDTN